MSRRSFWPLVLLLLAAAVVQAGIGASRPAGGPNTTDPNAPDYICTTCGPIPRSASDAAAGYRDNNVEKQPAADGERDSPAK